MKIVYIAHALSGDWEGNCADARLFAEAVARHGYAPVAPYLTLYGCLHEPEDRDIGVAIDEAMIARCDELWMCGTGVLKSVGSMAEAALARRLGVPVRHVLRPEDVS